VSGSGLAQYVRVSLPSSLEFSSISIIAELLNYESAKEGLTMLINYGPNVTLPETSQYLLKGIPSVSHRLNAEVSSKQVNPGEQIAIYLFLGVNNSVELSTSVMNNKMRILQVGEPISDFTTDNEVRLYTTDFSIYNQADLATR
jgi:hypothetical protein